MQPEFGHVDAGAAAHGVERFSGNGGVGFFQIHGQILAEPAAPHIGEQAAVEGRQIVNRAAAGGGRVGQQVGAVQGDDSVQRGMIGSQRLKRQAGADPDRVERIGRHRLGVGTRGGGVAIGGGFGFADEPLGAQIVDPPGELAVALRRLAVGQQRDLDHAAG